MTTPVLPTEQKSLVTKLLRPKVAIPLLLVFLVLITPFLIRGWFLRNVPAPPEPFDATPLLSYSVTDEENAFVDYRSAQALFVQPTNDVSDTLEQVREHGWQRADDDVKQFLHDNEDSLLAWKVGAEKDLALYLPAIEYDIAAPLPGIQDMRETHRTVMLHCLKLEAEGKPAEAWEWYRASIRSSRHVGTHGCLIERLVGIAIFSMAVNQVEDWAANPQLTSAELLRAKDDLLSAWQLTEKNSVAFQIEYLSTVQTIERFDSDEFRGLSSDSVAPAPGGVLAYVMGEPELSQRVIRFYFHNQLLFCDEPFYKRPNEIGVVGLFDDPAGYTVNGEQWSLDEFEAAFSRSTLARLLLPALSQARNAFDREEVRYNSLVVTLAGQAFQRDHGRFPKTLDELVPDYLDAIPIDIYDGTPLKYRFDSAGPVVYSVFKNQTDDGGLDWNYVNKSSGGTDPNDFGTQLNPPESPPLEADKP